MDKNINFNVSNDEYLYISPQGLQKIAQIYDAKDPHKNVEWTSDYTLELPIKVKKQGIASIVPITLVEMFSNTVQNHGEKPALSWQENNQWVTMNFQTYFENCKIFAKSLLALNVTQYNAINIIGFNSQEWFMSFYGSIFAGCLPVGIYTTNGPQACQYVAEHSNCEVAIVEDLTQMNKFVQVWDKLPTLRYIVVYKQQIPTEISEKYQGKIISWADFMNFGRKYISDDPKQSLEYKMTLQRPGNCCTLVYTSGTTGNPKGVMLSHDNYTWTAYVSVADKGIDVNANEKVVSYLPLSHVASQMIDIVATLRWGIQVFFARPTALQGSLVETLQEIRPTFFFSVPRVWEKIEEKMRTIAKANGWLKTTIATWAKSIGAEGTKAEYHEQSTPFGWGIAKKVVFNNVKKALGLDEARFLLYGAAPLAPSTRQYFLSLNMFLMSGYGMSECSGPQTVTDPRKYKNYDVECMKSTGNAMDGTAMKIDMPDKDGNGEICYKGRNRFMGYYKNDESTRQTIDSQGYLHSGDIGKIDKENNLAITGRIKELLITAGGENVAPVLIENILKDEIKIISNCMVVGDREKFLNVLICLRYYPKADGTPSDKLDPNVLELFKEIGSSAQNIVEARQCQKVAQYINDGIKRTNTKAISRAQNVQKYFIIDGDFTVDNGDLTPTLKLKRNVVTKKHEGIINQFYIEAKL